MPNTSFSLFVTQEVKFQTDPPPQILCFCLFPVLKGKMEAVDMNWFARRIHLYEQRRWKTDDNRRVQPFAWGLEHAGGPVDHPNPAEFFHNYAQQVIENSQDWYSVTPATDYHLDSDNVLTFTSSIESPWRENNT